MTDNSVDDISNRFMEVYPRLLKYAISKTNDKSSAHDLVMKSFMKVLERFKESQEMPERLDFYLIKVIRNTFLDEFKRSKRVTSIDDTDGYLEPVDPSLPSDPLMKKRIARAFGQLSENCREVLILVAQGMTYNDITEITNKTRNSVAGAIYKCRDKFRIYLYGENPRDTR